MSRWYVLDDNGDPVPEPDMFKAARWFEHSSRNNLRQIALSEFTDDVVLSTVFLGLDHNYFHTGDPILYESMWFGGIHNGEQRRYCTKQEALEGHKEMLAEAGYACKFIVGRTLKEANKPWFVGLATLFDK